VSRLNSPFGRLGDPTSLFELRRAQGASPYLSKSNLPAFARKPPPLAVDEWLRGSSATSSAGERGYGAVSQDFYREEATTFGGGASQIYQTDYSRLSLD